MSTNDSVGPDPGEANCLPRPDAEQLVFNCIPFAPPDTTDKVGDIFPDPVAQRTFCNCVKGNARAKGIDPNTIECGADSTLEDIIVSIAC